MNIKELKEMEKKVKGGNKGLLPKYLEMLQTDSLDKLKTCTPATLQFIQSRYATISEIINLLG